MSQRTAVAIVVVLLTTGFTDSLAFGQKVYWTGHYPDRDKILRSNLDGTALEEIISGNVAVVYGLALDLAAGKIYWTEV